MAELRRRRLLRGAQGKRESHGCSLHLFGALVFLAVAAQAVGGVIFDDDFTTFNTATVWEGAAGIPYYVGAVTTATLATIEGRSVVGPCSSVTVSQRRGYRTQQTFLSALPYARAELALKLISGLDGVVELGMLAPASGNYVLVRVFRSSYGTDRFMDTEAVIGTGTYRATNNTSGNNNYWQFGNWYR